MTRAEKLRAKEAWQLQRLQAMQAKPDYKGYFVVMMGLILLFQLFDIMATGVYSNLQEAVVLDFAGLRFDTDISVGGAGYQAYQDTLSQITFISMLSFGFMGIVPWYKSLADKVGRRPLFVLNCVLLGTAMFIGGITHNLVIYLVVSTVIQFFTLHDMQIMYVTECTPAASRGRWTGVLRAMEGVANMAVVLMRLLALNPDGTVGQVPWRMIYIIIGLIGIIVFLLSIFFLRESRPFIASRIHYLEKTPQQRALDAKQGKSNKGGVINGIKLMMKNKQLRWLAIATLLASTANNMVCSYNNSIMAQSGLDTIGITIGLIASSAVGILVGFLMGSLSDKIGRKWASAFFGVLSSLGFVLFIFVPSGIANSTIAGIVAGTFSGLSMNSYLNMMVLTTLMMGESSPASMRSSIIGVRSFFQVSAVVAIGISGVLFRSMPTGQVCLILSAPFLVASSLIILFKTKETKGLSMEQIEAQFE